MTSFPNIGSKAHEISNCTFEKKTSTFNMKKQTIKKIKVISLCKEIILKDNLALFWFGGVLFSSFYYGFL